MSIIRANWKAAVSGIRGQWIIVLITVVLTLFSLGPVGGLLNAFSLSLILLGFGTATKWGEVGRKPFSFVLPRYRESLRILYFSSTALVGLTITLFVLRVFLEWGGPSSSVGPRLARLFLYMVVGFLAGMSFLLLIEASDFAVSSPGIRGVAELASLPLIFIAISVLGAAGEYLFAVWGIFLPVWLALCVLFWIRLGDMRYVGQGHRLILQPPSERPAPRTTRRSTLPRAQDVFLWRMERYKPFSLGRSCWGSLYRSLAPALSAWRMELAALMFCAVVLSFTGARIGGMGLVSFGLMASYSVHLPLIPDAPLLLPAGRKERCVATGLITIAVSLLAVAFGLLVIALSWFFWLSISGALGAHAASKALTPIDPVYFYWSCVPVPWMSVFRLYEGKAARIVHAGAAAVVILLFLGAFPLPWQMVPVRKIHMVFAGALVGGWLFLLVTLWINSRAHDFAAVEVCAGG